MTDEERELLVVRYKTHPSPEEREKIIIAYAKEVKIISRQIYDKYPNGLYDLEDYEHYGILGLIDAIDRYDINMNTKFSTYVSIRIKGDILDNIRKTDISRGLRNKKKKYEDLTNKAIEKYHTYHPNREQIIEIAKEEGITIDEFKRIEKALAYDRPISLDEYLETTSTEIDEISAFSTNEGNGEKEILKKEMQDILEKALSILTEKERQVILLVYYEDMTLKESASILGVTDSRVSQIHSKALEKMREYLSETEHLAKSIVEMTDPELEEYIQKGGKNWTKISQNPNITEKFITKYRDKLNKKVQVKDNEYER